MGIYTLPPKVFLILSAQLGNFPPDTFLHRGKILFCKARSPQHFAAVDIPVIPAVVDIPPPGRILFKYPRILGEIFLLSTPAHLQTNDPFVGLRHLAPGKTVTGLDRISLTDDIGLQQQIGDQLTGVTRPIKTGGIIADKLRQEKFFSTVGSLQNQILGIHQQIQTPL